MSGWIKLHRQIQGHWLWLSEKPFDKRSAWIDILLMVNHEDKMVLLGNDLVEVKRGERLTSEPKLAERWGWSRTKVRNFLNLLEKDGMIENKKEGRKRTRLKVLNYNIYQGSEDSEKTSKKQVKNNERTSREQAENINKNDKNDKNDKEDIIIVEKPKFSDDHEATVLTKLLVKMMLQNNPNARIPKTEKQKERWIDALEKIHRLDGYSYEQIKKAIIWSQNNEFWKSNILSTAKLREKMPTLILQMERNNQRSKSRYERTVSELDRLYQEAIQSEQSRSH